MDRLVKRMDSSRPDYSPPHLQRSHLPGTFGNTAVAVALLYCNKTAARGSAHLSDLARQLQPRDGAVMNDPGWRELRFFSANLEYLAGVICYMQEQGDSDTTRVLNADPPNIASHHRGYRSHEPSLNLIIFFFVFSMTLATIPST